MLKVFLVLGILTSTHTWAQSPPSADPVAITLDAAIKSLQEVPNQFSVEAHVSITGVSIGGGNGTFSGNGLQIHANGGGAGSTTTGMIVNSSVSNQQIEIVKQDATDAMKQQAAKAIEILTEIKTLLQNKPTKIDKPKVMSKLAEFSKTYVAPVLISIIEALVKSRLSP